MSTPAPKGSVFRVSGPVVTAVGIKPAMYDIVRVGDEVLSPYWLRADTSSPVTARQIAPYHTQGNTASLYWYAKGTTSALK
ncbi:MAG: hypothetical protein ABR562_04710, partial [Thermoplasmatota archaeon]